MTAVQVDLDALTFNTGHDADGVRWFAGEVGGWEGPSSDQALMGMSSQGGTALGRSMLGARSLVLDGMVVAPTTELHWAAYNTLLATVNNLVTPRWLTVHEPTPKRVGYIRRDKPSVKMSDGLSFTFQVVLVATDPRKYATTPTTVTIPAGGSALVTGLGNYSSPATVVTGGTVNLLNQETGHRLSTSTNVPAGTIFDGSARTARAGAVDVFTALAPGFEWATVIPGGQTFTNSGSQSAELTFSDAWI